MTTADENMDKMNKMYSNQNKLETLAAIITNNLMFFIISYC